jgi:hypothetical protein
MEHTRRNLRGLLALLCTRLRLFLDAVAKVVARPGRLPCRAVDQQVGVAGRVPGLQDGGVAPCRRTRMEFRADLIPTLTLKKTCFELFWSSGNVTFCHLLQRKN